MLEPQPAVKPGDNVRPVAKLDDAKNAQLKQNKFAGQVTDWQQRQPAQAEVQFDFQNDGADQQNDGQAELPDHQSQLSQSQNSPDGQQRQHQFQDHNDQKQSLRNEPGQALLKLDPVQDAHKSVPATKNQALQMLIRNGKDKWALEKLAAEEELSEQNLHKMNYIRRLNSDVSLPGQLLIRPRDLINSWCFQNEILGNLNKQILVFVLRDL